MEQIFTPSVREAFLGALRENGIVGHACRAVGISRSTVERYRKSAPEFDAAVRDAIEDGIDVIEVEATRRAVHGVEKPVFYKGDEVATVREYSDSLLALLLTRRRYKETVKQEIEGNLEVKNMTPEQKASLMSKLLAAARLRKDASDLV